MKRIIVLLLVLVSFKSYCAEELSAEQKQLAWKFIYENMLSKENLPNVFKEDITINLKGEITSEDSIVVKDIIIGFQKAIPYLKINFSDKKGNLILGLNDGKNNRVTTNVSTDQGISYHEMYFPADLTQSQRKQFIYYHLFRGLIFYRHPKTEIPGMNGCVFAEKDFQSIIFSPLDIFILKKLYAPDFPIQLAMNLPTSLQEMAWNKISSNFLVITKTPVIYRKDIAIKLTGNVSQIDSIVMNEVIHQVEMIISNRKISISTDTANLVFDFNPKEGAIIGTSKRRFNNDILYRKVSIHLSDNITLEERKKTLYYYFTRSLFDLFITSSNSLAISGSVFDEQIPQNITYTPIDAFVMNKLYADDFNRQFKDQYIRRFSYRMYLVQMYGNELYSIFFVLALLIPSIFLIRLIMNGAFKPHHWNWKEYNKQGLYLTITYGLFLMINSLSDLQIEYRLHIVLISILQAFIAINLIYFAEWLIFSKRSYFGASKIIVIFLITLIGLTIPYSFSMEYKISSGIMNQSTSSNIPFLNIILLSLARCLYLFINDRYKSIINQKDVELAQMGELHKQAELQSLRAKINPHFLYNALNSIASLATTDGRKTEQMALSLSDFFKYAINREQKQLNTLSEELNAIRTYLEIEKVRFGERLNFEIECPAELLELHIPQLLIQPLVENALKHGLSQITEKGFIKVSISKEGNLLKIRVYDNGPVFPDGPLTGFGIQNTQERIALIYGAKAGINWQNGDEKYIEISLPLSQQLS